MLIGLFLSNTDGGGGWQMLTCETYITSKCISNKHDLFL